MARAVKARVGNQIPATEGTFSVNIFNKFINSQTKREGESAVRFAMPWRITDHYLQDKGDGAGALLQIL